jgi:hypothetical protein
MTDNPANGGTPGLTPHKAMKAAEKRRNAARHRVRPNDPASLEAFRQAEADHLAAYERYAVSLNPDAREIMAGWGQKAPPPKLLP